MKTDNIYWITHNLLNNSRNQPIEMSLADLVDQLEAIEAIPKETSWQMKLALLHYDFMDKIY